MNTQTAKKPTQVDDKHVDPAIKTGQEVQAATGTALAVVDIDEEDVGRGMQNISNEERKVPFIRILQSNSPELEEGGARYLPNAKAGMFFNTATKQTYTELMVIPCARDQKYIEYTPREIGGGFVGVHKPDDELILMLRAKHGKFGKLPRDVTKRDKDGKALDGTEIVQSFELYSICIDPSTGAMFRAIVSFQSTQISKYTSFIDRYDSIQYQTPDGKTVKPPLWAHRWLFKTGNEKNKKGSFKGFVIGLAEKNADGSDAAPIKSFIKKSDPLYVMGKEFNAFVEAGKAEVDYSTVSNDEPAKETEVEM